MSEVVPYDSDAVAKNIYIQRLQGLSFVEILEGLQETYEQLTMSNVVALYRNFQKSLSMAYGPDERQHLLGLELERLDALQAAFWTAAVTYRDEKAAAVVLNTMKTRHKLLGLDLPDGTDSTVQQTILVVGEDKEAFIRALAEGRNQKQILPGTDQDDGDVTEEAQ